MTVVNTDSLGNLRPPWKKGQSGNPQGRAPNAGWSHKQWLNQLATWEPDELESFYKSGHGPATKRGACKQLLDYMAGNADARREIAGNPKQQTEISGPDGGPVELSAVQVQRDLDKLSVDELVQYKALRDKMATKCLPMTQSPTG